MNSDIIILLQLLLAHILTDFVLQPTSWVRHKQNKKAASVYLYFHSFIAGALTYILLQDWELWYIAIIIGFSHFTIDLWKLQQKKDDLKIFLLDQLFHLTVIFLVWLGLTHKFTEIIPFLKATFSSATFMAILLAYIIVVFPVGFIIGKATKRWQHEIQEINEKSDFGLQDAGFYIGIFERILVLTFILTSNFSAIGFLIAAKSILRFNDKTEAGARKQTEYVLIGTLMSFAITILFGLLLYHIAF